MMQFSLSYRSFQMLADLHHFLLRTTAGANMETVKAEFDRSIWLAGKATNALRTCILVDNGCMRGLVDVQRAAKQGGITIAGFHPVTCDAERVVSSFFRLVARLRRRSEKAKGLLKARIRAVITYIETVKLPFLQALANCKMEAKNLRRIGRIVIAQARKIFVGANAMSEDRMVGLIASIAFVPASGHSPAPMAI